MLQPARRALLIGYLGPAIQALGFVWTALHLTLGHWSTQFGPRHLVYEPGVLLIIVGFLVSLASVSVAVDVARASEEDVQIPVYAPEPDESDIGGGLSDTGALRRERLARYSTGTGHRSTGPEPEAQSPR